MTVLSLRCNHGGRFALGASVLLLIGLRGCAEPQRTAEPTAVSAPLQRYTFTEPHMGTQWRIVLYAEGARTAAAASREAFSRVTTLNQVMSDYLPDSEINELATAKVGQPVAVSDDLWRVLRRSQYWARQTDGAFDVTIGPAVKLWRRARRQRALPGNARLNKALASVGYQHLHVALDVPRVTLEHERMRLDLGGIGKGFAAQEALRSLAEQGINRAMIDAGGDIVIGDPPPGQAGWRLRAAPMLSASAAVEDPSAEPAWLHDDLLLARCAVMTSGDAFQFVEIAGVRYSHILNQRTGTGLTPPIAATVIAPDGADADALATATCALGPHAGTKLINSLENTHAIIVMREGNALRVFRSVRWDRLQRAP